MNVNEFDIVTDYTRGGVPCELGIVAVCKNIKCNDCATISEFNPMLSDGENWQCLECWSDGDKHMLSENMHERLHEATANMKHNYLIRNMGL